MIAHILCLIHKVFGNMGRQITEIGCQLCGILVHLRHLLIPFLEPFLQSPDIGRASGIFLIQFF